MSTCWTTVSITTPLRAPPSEERSQRIEVVGGEVGDVAGCDLEVVEVRFVAVARADRGDGLVVGVHDDVFALAEAERENPALPPGEVLPGLHSAARSGSAPFVPGASASNHTSRPWGP